MKTSVLIEIRGAEGGEDAKLLATDQFRIYTRVAEKRNISIELTDERPGFISFLAYGEGARELFANEGGGHRFQRVPPTERSGRVQTSTITVAVLDLDNNNNFQLRESDVEFVATRGSGPGGQNRNKVETCIVATHKPTGLSVRIDTRSQFQNKKLAMQVLAARLSEAEELKKQGEQNATRKSQLGSGMRGDKIRTYREKDDTITDHRTNKKGSLANWLKGNW